MKKKILNFWLLALMVMLGGMNAWADTTTLLEYGTANVAWTAENLAEWTAGGTPTISDDGTYVGISGGNGSYATSKTIAPTSQATVNVTAVWRGSSNTGRAFEKGNGSYFRFGNIVVAQNDQDKKHGYTFSGLDDMANVTTFSAGSYRTAIENCTWLLIEMEINTATNTLTSFSIKSEDGATTYASAQDIVLANADYTTVAFGYRKSGSVSYANAEQLKSLMVTEAPLGDVKTTTIFEYGTADVAWSENNLAEWTAGGTPTISEDGLHVDISGGNGSYATSKTLSPQANTILNVSAVWRGSSGTGRAFDKGNASYFRFGNIVVAQNDQDKKHGYTFSGLDDMANVTTFTAGSYRTDIENCTWLLIEMEINTANNTLNSFSIKSEDGATTYASVQDVVLSNADYSVVAFGYRKSGSVSNTNAEQLKSIKITETTQAVILADYTIEYKCGDVSVKENETRTGIVGQGISLNATDMQDFYAADGSMKYIYVSTDAEGKTVTEEGTTVTVTFREAGKFAWIAKSSVGSYSVSGESWEGDKASAKYPQYVHVDGKLWSKAAINSTFSQTFDVTENNQEFELAYTETDIEAIYYSEVEDIEGMGVVDYGNAAARSSQCAAGYSISGNTAFTTLPAGKYKIVASFYSPTSAGGTYNFYAGNRNVWTIKTNNANATLGNQEIVLAKETALLLGQGGYTAAVDYIYIQSLGESTAEELAAAQAADAFADAQADLQAAITEAKAIDTEEKQGVDELNEAIATAETALAAEDATTETLGAALLALQQAVEAFNAANNPAPAELTEWNVTYALQEGDTFTSAQTVEVKDDADNLLATITYGEEGGADFKAAKADAHVDGYVAFTEGNGTNGNKAGGTFYTIAPVYDGTISVAVVLNADKAFYVMEDGVALADYDGINVTEKYYGTFTFDVAAGKSYKFYCAGSKLGFYGFNYKNKSAEPEIVPGDLSGDGEVTVSDAVPVVDYVLGAQEPTEAQKKAADVNKDNEITVSDVSGIVSIALGLWDGTIAEAARGMANNDYVVLNGTEVGLVNANQYVAFQMDVTLAEGAQLNGVSRTARTLGYQVAWNRVGRNTYRIVAFSLANESLSQNEGALLNLDLTGNQQLTLSNIEFADAQARAYALGLAETTGISSLNISTADSQTYTLGGARSNQLQKGVNIVRSNDGQVKKVLVK